MELLKGYTKDSKEYKRHLEYQNKGFYQLKCSDIIFSPEEIRIIHDKGYWMEALEDGILKPIIKEQIHFLEVCKCKTKPLTKGERAWFKHQGRRKIEAKLGNKLNIQYQPEEDQFYSREGHKKVHKSMFGVIRENHRRS